MLERLGFNSLKVLYTTFKPLVSNVNLHPYIERGAFEVNIEGEGEDSLPRDDSNAIVQAVKMGYEAARPGEPLPEVRRRKEGTLGGGLRGGLCCVVHLYIYIKTHAYLLWFDRRRTEGRC